MFLVLLLIGVLPLKQHPLWTGSGGEMTFAKYLGAVCLAYAAIYLGQSGRIPRHLATWAARLYLVFVLLVFVSYLQEDASFARTWHPLLGPTSLLALFVIVLAVTDTLSRLRWVLLAAVGSVGWASMYVLREWQKARGWSTGFRGGWVTGDANHFGVCAVFGMLLAWYLAQSTSGWQRWLCRISMLAALAAAVFGAASRGGLLGLAAAIVYASIRTRRHRARLIAVIALLLAFNLLYPYSPLRRLQNPNANDRGSELAHRASWDAGLHMIAAHPITGIGIAAFKSQMDRYAPAWYDGPAFMAHNAYISVAAEMGIFGLLAFLSVWVAAFLSLERLRRQKWSAPRLIVQTAAGLQAVLVGNAVAILFISGEHHEHVWLPMFLAMCLPPLAERYAKKKAPATSAEPDAVPRPVALLP